MDLSDERMLAIMARELWDSGGVKQWWWLSFADKDGFRGVAIVNAYGRMSAIQLAWNLHINPGGECAAVALGFEPAPQYQNRLLSKSEADCV